MTEMTRRSFICHLCIFLQDQIQEKRVRLKVRPEITKPLDAAAANRNPILDLPD
jgi:hypothetical protein